MHDPDDQGIGSDFGAFMGGLVGGMFGVIPGLFTHHGAVIFSPAGSIVRAVIGAMLGSRIGAAPATLERTWIGAAPLASSPAALAAA